MKIFKIFRLVLTGVMIGISCISPISVKETFPTKFQIEQKEEDDTEE